VCATSLVGWIPPRATTRALNGAHWQREAWTCVRLAPALRSACFRVSSGLCLGLFLEGAGAGEGTWNPGCTLWEYRAARARLDKLPDVGVSICVSARPPPVLDAKVPKLVRSQV
jgi:hypothetical protein